MESLERKDTSVGTEEPVKSEEMVTPSPATSDRSNGAASPPPHCSICLGKLINTSFTDSCLHQFCFNCLLQWSKIKTECPLCKQTFKSIIHNVRSEGDYDQYHVQYTSHAATLDVTADIHINRGPFMNIDIQSIPQNRPFMYRTTNYHRRSDRPTNYHSRAVLLNPEAVARREQIPSIAPQVSSEERRRRSGDPLAYRRMVYRTGVWATPLSDRFGLFRECNADYYSRYPLEINRLTAWLNRELQVLLDTNQHHIVYVLNEISDALTRIDINSNEFRNLVRRHFGIHTDHFQHEFYNFARSNFDMVGYDQSVTYYSNRGFSNEYVSRAISPESSSSSSTSSDSEVRVIDHVCDFRRLLPANTPSVGPHLIDLPGPSSVEQAIGLRQINYMEPDILTISSTSSESENECEVVAYVKPRHERTPEIIDLSSSDGEHANVELPLQMLQSTVQEVNETELVLPIEENSNLPSTSTSAGNRDVNSRRTRRCAPTYYMDSSSESNTDETDSDYKPSSKCKSRRNHKSTSKKSSRKLGSLKRTKSTGKSRSSRKQCRNKGSPARNLFINDDTCSEEEKDTSSVRGMSSSRSKKRSRSKSSDNDTNYEKSNKKMKKSKKSKSNAQRPSSRTYKYSSDDESSRIISSSSDSDSEVENKTKSRKRAKKTSASSANHSSEPSAEKPSCSKRTGTTRKNATYQRKNNRLVDYDFSDDERSPKRLSSVCEKVLKQILKSNYSSDDEDFNNATTLYPTSNNKKSSARTNTRPSTSCQSSERSGPATDSQAEHSASSSSSSKLYRKRRRSKTRRRSSSS